MVLLFREVSRSDMGVFMDELIAEKASQLLITACCPALKVEKERPV